MNHLDEAVYNRFIKPLSRPATRLAGIEIELPIVNLRKEPVDFTVCHELADRFLETFHFSPTAKDDEGYVTCAESAENGDTFSFDCSYNTLEFSFAPEYDLNKIEQRFRSYYHFAQSFFQTRDYTLTGMGINPYRKYNRNVPIHSGRYRMLLHHLQSYPKYSGTMLFHDMPNFGLFSAASQVQLDVDRSSVTDVLHTFTMLEPLKAVLFANSLLPERPDLILNRDRLWENSTHGINPHNIGLLRTDLQSIDEIVDYIESMSIYCVERDGKYINFSPIPLRDYFASESVTGEYFAPDEDTAAEKVSEKDISNRIICGHYEPITFSPRPEDLAYLRSFKFEDLTYRGTVEFRSGCSQPVGEALTYAAFHAGLMEKEERSELKDILDHDHVIYRHGYNTYELRNAFCRTELPSFVDPDALRGLLHSILTLAQRGLVHRNRNEAHLLDPLFVRAESLTSPGKEMWNGLQSGESVETYIRKFSH